MIVQLTKSFATCLLLVALISTDGISQGSSSAISAGRSERVALLPFECRGFSSDEVVRLNRSFGGGLAESQRFTVVQDSAVKFRLEEAGISNIDSCTSRSCLASLGKILNAEKVVRVEAERWDQRYMLHIQMVRSSDAGLLYDERVDYSGEVGTFTSSISAEQGKKLAAAYLDKKPNWLLIGVVAIGGIGLIIWLLRRFDSTRRSIPLNSAS